MSEKAVLVLSDHTRVNGEVDRFDPGANLVLLRELDGNGKVSRIRDIDSQSILAIFFVRDLAVWRSYRLSRNQPITADPNERSGLQVRLETVWGERLEGRIVALDSDRQWLRFYPSRSERSPNIRYVVLSRRAIREILHRESASLPSSDRARIVARHETGLE